MGFKIYVKGSGIKSVEELRELFDGIEEEAIATDEMLKAMWQKASHCVCAREIESDCLVGFARSMDDNTWNANIDCLVVHKDYQHIGVGTMLLQTLLDELKDVVCICVSPDCDTSASFYEKFGFRRVRSGCLLKKLGQ